MVPVVYILLMTSVFWTEIIIFIKLIFMKINQKSFWIHAYIYHLKRVFDLPSNEEVVT